MATIKQSEINRASARKEIPPDTGQIFEALCLDYGMAALKHLGRRRLHYGVLSELIKAGWRKGAQSEIAPLRSALKEIDQHPDRLPFDAMTGRLVLAWLSGRAGR